VKILFVGNDASRTGAPIVLLCFLQWLKENTDVDFEVLLRIGRGPLLPDYQSLAPVTFYDRLDYNPTILERLLRRLGFRQMGKLDCLSEVEQVYRNRNIDLIYSNTITNGGIIGDLALLRLPVICHVHELEWGIGRYGRRNLSLVKQHAGRIVAVSDAVRRNLIDSHGFSPDRVKVIHPMLPVRPPPRFEKVAAVKASLGLKESDFAVGGSGSHAWRKGRDIFTNLAREVRSLKPGGNIHFVWVGGASEDNAADKGLPDGGETTAGPRLHFVPEVENPLDYFAAFDAFAMVSREDPYPVANLECASLGKPILCFAGSGGSQEFVGEDAGFVVPYPDVRAMADIVLLLAQDDGLRARLGKRAAEKAREHNVSVIAPRLLNIIRHSAL